jgi:hypothetical protein
MGAGRPKARTWLSISNTGSGSDQGSGSHRDPSASSCPGSSSGAGRIHATISTEAGRNDARACATDPITIACGASATTTIALAR